MNQNHLKSLQKIKDQIEERLEGREMSYDDKSEKWQESEKGVDFEDKTNELQEVFDNLEITIDSLETFLS